MNSRWCVVSAWYSRMFSFSICLYVVAMSAIDCGVLVILTDVAANRGIPSHIKPSNRTCSAPNVLFVTRNYFYFYFYFFLWKHMYTHIQHVRVCCTAHSGGGTRQDTHKNVWLLLCTPHHILPKHYINIHHAAIPSVIRRRNISIG